MKTKSLINHEAKTYTNYVGNSPNGKDSGSDLARFASANQDKYQINVNIKRDDFESIGTVTAAESEWKKIEKDYLDDFEQFYGYSCPHPVN